MGWLRNEAREGVLREQSAKEGYASRSLLTIEYCRRLESPTGSVDDGLLAAEGTFCGGMREGESDSVVACVGIAYVTTAASSWLVPLLLMLYSPRYTTRNSTVRAAERR